MSGATDRAPGRRRLQRRTVAAAAAALGLVLLPLPAPAQPVSPAPSVSPLSPASGAATPPAPASPASPPGSQGSPGSPGVGPTGQPSGPGLRLYQQRCAWCHGQQGEGSQQAPTLIGVGAAASDFMLTTGRMPYQNQRAFLLRHRPVFTPSEIRDLDELVASFGGGGPEIPQVGRGHSQTGRELFQENCAACHSTGVGGALTEGRIAPPLLQANPTQVGEAIRVGPYVMPLFDESVLDAGDVNDLAAYVGVLQNKPAALDRGGLPLGRIGPFSEGAVAWGLGILLLMLFARLLGSRKR